MFDKYVFLWLLIVLGDVVNRGHIVANYCISFGDHQDITMILAKSQNCRLIHYIVAKFII